MKIKIPDVTKALDTLASGLPDLERRVPQLRQTWKEKGGAGGLVGQSVRDAWTARLANELRRRDYARILVLSAGGREAVSLALRNLSSTVTAAAVNYEATAKVSAEKLERGAGNLEVETVHADGMPFEDDSFDCAVTLFSLEAAGSASSVLRELVRVVHPGGTVYCLEETREGTFGGNPLKSAAVKPFRRQTGRGLHTRRELCALLAGAGLGEVASYGHILDAAACCRGIK